MPHVTLLTSLPYQINSVKTTPYSILTWCKFVRFQKLPVAAMAMDC